MNTKYIRIISILVVVMIGLGCVDKSIDDTSQKINVTKDQVDAPVSGNGESTSEDNITDVSDSESKNDNSTVDDNTIDVSGDVTETESVSEDNTTVDDSTTIDDNTSADDSTTVDDNTTDSTLDTPVNDTSVTEIFKIGEQKNMLGVNIKLVNITDYENNTATISIDNVEYKYDPDSENTIQAKGIEIIDLTTIKEDNTAEITVDHISQ